MPKLVTARPRRVLLAQMLAHVLALEPGLHVAAGLVGAALVGAAVQAGGLPGLGLGRRRARLCRPGWAHTRGQALGQLGCASPGVGSWAAVLGAGQDGLDHAVHQQVGVAADRAGEVGVGLEARPKWPLLMGV
jgi:hypothetical protein